MKKNLSERQQLIKGWESRVKFFVKKLATTKAFHRKVESEIMKKTRQAKLQLQALKK